MATTNDAPFLRRIRLAELDDAPGENGGNEDAASGTADDSVDGWNKDDFPAWYQDKVDNEPSPDEATQSPDQDKDKDSQDSDNQDKAENYALELAAVQTLDQLRFGSVTVLAGNNGAGKSTVLEAIAIAAGFNPEGGSRNLNFSTHNTHSDLADHLVLEWGRQPRWGWFLRAETFYGMASHIENDEYLAPTFPQFHHRSHGESFLDLATSRFTGVGLYLLDEPESALSVQGLMSLCGVINKSLAKGSQFIISTHSPLLMAFANAKVFELDATSGISEATFESLESTVLWRRFFADPNAFHQNVL